MPDAFTSSTVGSAAWDKPLPPRPTSSSNSTTSAASPNKTKKAIDKIWAIADALQSPPPTSPSKSTSSHSRTNSRTHSRTYSVSKSYSHSKSHSRGPSLSSLLKKTKKATKLPAETFWPNTLDQECEKAGRVLRGFCRDGSVIVSAAEEKGGEAGRMIVPSSAIASARALVIFTVLRGGLCEGPESEGSGVLIARRDTRHQRHRQSSGTGEGGAWSPPVGITVSPPSAVEWPDGMDIYDSVLVLNTSAALDSLTHNPRWTINEANVVAGPLQSISIFSEPSTLNDPNSPKPPPLISYSRNHGRLLSPVLIAGSVITQRSSENARFYSSHDPSPIPTSDILSGKIVHPPEGITSLITTLDALSSPSSLPHPLAPEVLPAPSDYDLLPPPPPVTPTPSIQEPIFGIPATDDPDPFGVLALENAGLEIREAGTRSRPDSEQFEYRPSLTSPVWRDSFGNGGMGSPIGRVSVDHFSQGSARRTSKDSGRRESNMANVNGHGRRESQAQLIRMSVDRGIQTDFTARALAASREGRMDSAASAPARVEQPHSVQPSSPRVEEEDAKLVDGFDRQVILDKVEAARRRPLPAHNAPPTPPTQGTPGTEADPVIKTETETERNVQAQAPAQAREHTPPPSRHSNRHQSTMSASPSPTSPVSPLSSVIPPSSFSPTVSSALSSTSETISVSPSDDEPSDEETEGEEDVEIHTVTPTVLPTSPIRATANQSSLPTMALQQPKMVSVNNKVKMVNIPKRIPPKLPTRSPARERKRAAASAPKPAPAKDERAGKDVEAKQGPKKIETAPKQEEQTSVEREQVKKEVPVLGSEATTADHPVAPQIDLMNKNEAPVALPPSNRREEAQQADTKAASPVTGPTKVEPQPTFVEVKKPADAVSALPSSDKGGKPDAKVEPVSILAKASILESQLSGSNRKMKESIRSAVPLSKRVEGTELKAEASPVVAKPSPIKIEPKVLDDKTKEATRTQEPSSKQDESKEANAESPMVIAKATTVDRHRGPGAKKARGGLSSILAASLKDQPKQDTPSSKAPKVETVGKVNAHSLAEKNSASPVGSQEEKLAIKKVDAPRSRSVADAPVVKQEETVALKNVDATPRSKSVADAPVAKKVAAEVVPKVEVPYQERKPSQAPIKDAKADEDKRSPSPSPARKPRDEMTAKKDEKPEETKRTASPAPARRFPTIPKEEKTEEAKRIASRSPARRLQETAAEVVDKPEEAKRVASPSPARRFPVAAATTRDEKPADAKRTASPSPARMALNGPLAKKDEEAGKRVPSPSPARSALVSPVVKNDDTTKEAKSSASLSPTRKTPEAAAANDEKTEEAPKAEAPSQTRRVPRPKPTKAPSAFQQRLALFESLKNGEGGAK